MLVDSVLFPLDTIKTRLQQRRGTGAAHQAPTPFQARSFYRGLLSNMAGSFPAAATFWSVYEAAKSASSHLAAPDDDLQQGARHAACAAAADVAVTVVRNPFEVVKQQMQVGMHASTASAVRSIFRAEGPRGFYAGFFSTVSREIPFDAIEFALYELFKRRRARERQRDLVLWENAALGAIAGGVAAAVTTPLDVVKTRMMTQPRLSSSSSAAAAAAPRYTGWAHAFRTILREEGAGALAAGMGPRVVWISVGGAIFIGSFEELRRRVLTASSSSEHSE